MTAISETPDPKTVDDRVEELREIEDELRLVAQSDLPYAKHARGFLQTLREVDNE